jgi:hypothetical protein
MNKLGDTHLAGYNRIYGLMREARWAVDCILLRLDGSVKDSHIHLPEPNPDVLLLSLSLSFNLTVSLFQPHSESFLTLEPPMVTVQNCNCNRHQITQYAVI